MSQKIRFAINRISAPRIPFAEFAGMTRRLGVDAIEIRNDLPGIELVDGTPAKEVGAAARTQGLVIRSINALQRFEQFDAARESEAKELIRYAVDSGTQALVLCPTNSRQDSRSPQK